MKYWLLLLGLVSTYALGQVEMKAIPEVITEIDSLTLKIRAEGIEGLERPDLHQIEQHFDIINSQTNSQHRSINGTVESWVDYSYKLRPKSSGTIIIRPITFGRKASNELTITVKPIDDSTRRQIEESVFFETELTVDPVYVNSQTIYIRRLYFAPGVQLYNTLPDGPELQNAVVISLGTPSTSNRIMNGRTYGVIEQRYAIFPESSGPLAIPESSITSSVRLNQKGTFRRTSIKIVAPPTIIDVLPIPPNYPRNKPWLAAKNVEISEAWEPKKLNFEVGSQISRKITITAYGNTAASINPIARALGQTSLKRYPRKAQLTDVTSADNITGKRTETHTFVPLQQDTVSLSPINITWWNTDLNRTEIAHLKEREITFYSHEPNLVERTTTSKKQVADPLKQNSLAEEELSSSPSADPLKALLLYSSIIFALLLGWSFSKSPRSSKNNYLEKQNHRPRLAHALKSSSPLKVKHALLALASRKYKSSKLLTLKRILEEPKGKIILNKINTLSFGSKPGHLDKNTKDEIQKLAKALTKKEKEKRRNTLPDLYA